MLQKSLKAVATFHTTHDAIGAEDLCAEKCVKGRLIPLPPEIDASCGLAFMMEIPERAHFLEVVDGRIAVEGMYELMLRG